MISKIIIPTLLTISSDRLIKYLLHDLDLQSVDQIDPICQYVNQLPLSLLRQLSILIGTIQTTRPYKFNPDGCWMTELMVWRSLVQTFDDQYLMKPGECYMHMNICYDCAPIKALKCFVKNIEDVRQVKALYL